MVPPIEIYHSSFWNIQSSHHLLSCTIITLILFSMSEMFFLSSSLLVYAWSNTHHQFLIPLLEQVSGVPSTAYIWALIIAWRFDVTEILRTYSNSEYSKTYSTILSVLLSFVYFNSNAIPNILVVLIISHSLKLQYRTSPQNISNKHDGGEYHRWYYWRPFPR